MCCAFAVKGVIMAIAYTSTVQIPLAGWLKTQELTGMTSQKLLDYFTAAGVLVELT